MRTEDLLGAIETWKLFGKWLRKHGISKIYPLAVGVASLGAPVLFEQRENLPDRPQIDQEVVRRSGSAGNKTCIRELFPKNILQWNALCCNAHSDYATSSVASEGI